MIEIIGWLGAALLALCGAPQAWQSFQNQHSDGISWYFIGMWGGGEALLLLYIFTTMGITPLSIPLLANLGVNLFFVGVIAWYRIK